MRALTLTVGERLIMARRRDRVSQKDMADSLRVTLYTYQKFEKISTTSSPLVNVPVEQIKPHDDCYFRRRRAGMTRVQMAEKAGISLTWVTQIERGEAPPRLLVEYWQKVEKPWRNPASV